MVCSILLEFDQSEHLVSCGLEDVHLVKLGKVAEKSDEQFEISHLIQHVLIPELFRSNIADSLLELGSALACLTHQSVVHHIATDALQILHLICDHTPIENIKQSSFNTIKAQWFSTLTNPHERHRISCSIKLIQIVQIIITANIDILAV